MTICTWSRQICRSARVDLGVSSDVRGRWTACFADCNAFWRILCAITCCNKNPLNHCHHEALALIRLPRYLTSQEPTIVDLVKDKSWTLKQTSTKDFDGVGLMAIASWAKVVPSFSRSCTDSFPRCPLRRYPSNTFLKFGTCSESCCETQWSFELRRTPNPLWFGAPHQIITVWLFRLFL